MRLEKAVIQGILAADRAPPGAEARATVRALTKGIFPPRSLPAPFLALARATLWGFIVAQANGRQVIPLSTYVTSVRAALRAFFSSTQPEAASAVPVPAAIDATFREAVSDTPARAVLLATLYRGIIHGKWTQREIAFLSYAAIAVPCFALRPGATPEVVMARVMAYDRCQAMEVCRPLHLPTYERLPFLFPTAVGVDVPRTLLAQVALKASDRAGLIEVYFC